MKINIVGTNNVVLSGHANSKSVIQVTGDLGSGSAKLAFSSYDGTLVDVPEGELAVGDVFELTHGTKNYPVIVAVGVTKLLINYHGV